MADNPLIDLTGPLLIGSLLSYFLSGAFVMQIYHYYMNYAKSDRKSFIFLVWLVIVIEILNIIMATHVVYTTLALGFNNPRVFVQTPWSGNALPAINGLGALCTQIFFAWRIAALTKASRSVTLGAVIAGVIILMAFAQCAAAFALTIQYSLLSSQLELLITLKRTAIAWLGGSFACDTVITIAMVAILWHARETTSFKGSRNMLDALIIHSIESGAITSVCALADLLTYLVLPETLYHVCFEFLLGRLYANVLLAALNGRSRMRQMGERTTSSEFDLSTNKSARRKTVKPEINHLQLGGSTACPSEGETTEEYELKMNSSGVIRDKSPQIVH